MMINYSMADIQSLCCVGFTRDQVFCFAVSAGGRWQCKVWCGIERLRLKSQAKPVFQEPYCNAELQGLITRSNFFFFFFSCSFVVDFSCFMYALFQKLVGEIRAIYRRRSMGSLYYLKKLHFFSLFQILPVLGSSN